MIKKLLHPQWPWLPSPLRNLMTPPSFAFQSQNSPFLPRALLGLAVSPPTPMASRPQRRCLGSPHSLAQMSKSPFPQDLTQTTSSVSVSPMLTCQTHLSYRGSTNPLLAMLKLSPYHLLAVL